MADVSSLFNSSLSYLRYCRLLYVICTYISVHYVNLLFLSIWRIWSQWHDRVVKWLLFPYSLSLSLALEGIRLCKVATRIHVVLKRLHDIKPEMCVSVSAHVYFVTNSCQFWNIKLHRINISGRCELLIDFPLSFCFLIFCFEKFVLQEKFIVWGFGQEVWLDYLYSSIKLSD